MDPDRTGTGKERMEEAVGVRSAKRCPWNLEDDSGRICSQWEEGSGQVGCVQGILGSLAFPPSIRCQNERELNRIFWDPCREMREIIHKKIVVLLAACCSAHVRRGVEDLYTVGGAF